MWFTWNDEGLQNIFVCYAYDLPSFLAKILSPLSSSSDFTVTTTAHFVSIISSERIHDHKNTVSFNIESLLTNVPIEGAVGAALQKLKSDRTTLKPAQIADLLDFVLRSTYFRYNGSI